MRWSIAGRQGIAHHTILDGISQNGIINEPIPFFHKKLLLEKI